MKQYKKTILGSFIAIFIGTSCCWLSSLAIWIGGVTFIGTTINLIEGIQAYIIGIGIFLFVISLFLYSKNRFKQL